MDISVFYLNRKRFWGWILIPLVLRLLVTAVFAYTTRSAVEELDRNKVYKRAVDEMEAVRAKSEEWVAPHRADLVTPFQGWFLTVISRNAKEAGVDVTNSPEIKPIKGTQLQQNIFKLSGTAPSLHDFSLFVDLMMLEPKAVITGVDLSSRTQRTGNEESEVVSFRITFERVELGGGE